MKRLAEAPIVAFRQWKDSGRSSFVAMSSLLVPRNGDEHCVRLVQSVTRSVVRAVLLVLFASFGTTLMSTITAASAEGQTALNQTALSQFHSGCKTADRSRTADCVAAISRYCNNKAYGNAGLSQEVTTSVIGVGCFAASVHNVPMIGLRNKHSGCNDMGLSQSPECMAAAHRWCVAYASKGAGIIQEVGASDFAVACFNPISYQDVALSALKAKHSGCNSLYKSQDADCMAAVHRWCQQHQPNTNLGLVQEIGANVFGVACFAGWYGDVKFRRPLIVDSGGGWRPSASSGGERGSPPTPPTPTTRNLRVVMSYQAPPLLLCQAAGIVTAKSNGVNDIKMSYTFSGPSLPNPPFCETNVEFTSLKPGNWTFSFKRSNSTNFLTCATAVVASTAWQIMHVKLNSTNSGGTCQ